jgi:hypothetical protein
MSFCEGFVGVVWDDVPNSKENGLEDLTPEVESRIAELDGPYNESTEILDDFNYERDKLDIQIEIASQSSISYFFSMDGYIGGDHYNNHYILCYSTWKNTGWNYQFVLMKFFERRALRFPSTTSSEVFLRMLGVVLSKILVWFDTGWLFLCFLQEMLLGFLSHFSHVRMCPCLRAGIFAEGG